MRKPKKLMGVQQILLHPDKETQSILEYLCSESNKLHNCATYYARQVYFKTKKYVTGFDLINEMRSSQNRHFQAFLSDAAEQTCISVGESIRSFSELLKMWFRGELEEKPKFPNYRKPGYQVVSFPARGLRLKDGQIKFSLGIQVKAWFGVKEFFLPMPANLDFSVLREVRILPRNGCFYAEFVYPAQSVVSDVDPSRVLGIDHGLNNWLTGVSNVGTSFIVDGLKLKSLNQWYNKQTAKHMEGKANGFWSKRLAAAAEKRNRQMRDATNKTARIVIQHCLDNRIGTLVFGWNKGQKDSINLGRKTNQKFVQIPTARLKGRIEQLCLKYGIHFVETEESYTSKASFLDSDVLPKFGEKPEGWKESGKRVKRGLYRSADGTRVNADCNGAANILRKVAIMLGLDLSGISSGDLTAPLKLRFWVPQESPSL
jgi:putative transposase